MRQRCRLNEKEMGGQLTWPCMLDYLRCRCDRRLLSSPSLLSTKLPSWYLWVCSNAMTAVNDVVLNKNSVVLLCWKNVFPA